MPTLKLVLACVIVFVVITIILITRAKAVRQASRPNRRRREKFGTPQEEVNAVRYVTLHHTKWCPACTRMKPVWDSVKARLAGRPIRMIENDEDKAPTEGVDAYPTIYLLDEYGKRYQYHGGPDASQLMRFILAPGRGAINV
jgi:hypothetical protein